MAQYSFVSVWQYAAPVEQIWPILSDMDNWPTWWRGVQRVELLEPAGVDGLGALRRLTWRSQLPYDLVFDSRVVRSVPEQELAGEVSGELQGTGVWTLQQNGDITRMQYNWNVSTTKAWMNALTPIARPFFSWNHDVVMGWGGEGLAKRLGTPLIK